MLLEEIKKKIESAVPQAEVHVLDPMNDGEHLQSWVISPAFAGMPLIQQHQMVMGALREALAQKVHALSLKTFTPEKWNEVKSQYGF